MVPLFHHPLDYFFAALILLAIGGIAYGLIQRRRITRSAAAEAKRATGLPPYHNELQRTLARLQAASRLIEDAIKSGDFDPDVFDRMETQVQMALNEKRVILASYYLHRLRLGAITYEAGRQQMDHWLDRMALSAIGTSEEELSQLEKLCAEEQARRLLTVLRNTERIDAVHGVDDLIANINTCLEIAGIKLGDIGTSRIELRDLKRDFHGRCASKLLVEIQEQQQHGVSHFGGRMHAIRVHLAAGNLLPEEVGITAEELAELDPPPIQPATAAA